MHFKAHVTVKFKESVLEPQGQAIMLTAKDKGKKEILNVRVGKYIELDLEADSKEKAFRQAKEFTEEILYNPVMERYHISIDSLEK